MEFKEERKIMDNCKHENMEYQAPEWDTNVPEDYYCLDCNEQFDIPEPDEDIWRDR